MHNSKAFINNSLVKPETHLPLLQSGGNKASATVFMASLRGMLVYRLTMSKEHMEILLGITIFFRSLDIEKESFAEYSLMHNGLIMGTRSFASEYVAVLIADKTGLQGVSALWIFGNAYRRPGVEPVGVSC